MYACFCGVSISVCDIYENVDESLVVGVAIVVVILTLVMVTAIIS